MLKKLSLIILVIIIGAGVWGWKMFKSGRLREVVVQQVSQRVFKAPGEMNAVYDALGFKIPRTYLVLFLNNTELRPGGGFIGAYATIRINKGRPEILKVEGTEILDNSAPKDSPLEPPAPLKDYLFVKKWNFRDSNWSPDFASSSVLSMEMYKKERGTAADEVSGVIGITPTVIEEVLKITGPIKVGKETYDSRNVVEKLEYEVEYGYAKRGLDFDERKKALQDMTRVLIRKLEFDIFTHWSKYLELAERMAGEKHLVGYSVYPEAESALAIKDWAGLMKQNRGDYLLWADANLASLKTDRVMSRSLTYSLTPSTVKRTSSTTEDVFMAKVKMKYEHRGRVDPFTTRYRTYVRIFVPVGSRFIKVKGPQSEKAGAKGKVDHGIENGRQWFGTFIVVEPGRTEELEWTYYAAPQVVERITNGDYKLLIQKQIGTIAHDLNLALNFGKRVVSASPGELAEKHGDDRYDYKTDLRVDREVEVRLE